MSCQSAPVQDCFLVYLLVCSAAYFIHLVLGLALASFFYYFFSLGKDTGAP
ncbi:unnamed protein product [Staurois parvus]|uniref:Uncharacterized protein n=1 Tax=Staurois parvus TaxID=386267 RepID=A0ABN9F7V3_9NEOB|nr:unnamed protein product [Staurois parvus]